MARITFVILTIWLSLVTMVWSYPRQHFEDPDSFQVAGKRSAVFLDRLLVAFQKALSAEDSHFSKPVNRQSELHYDPGVPLGRNPSSERFGLERRGQVPKTKTGRVFWRCYFNAVTCF